MTKSIKIEWSLASFTVTDRPTYTLAVVSFTLCTCAAGIYIGFNVSIFELPPVTG